MKAAVYRRYGGPEALELAELPAPEPGPDQVLLRVIAASVNPVDWKIASGRLRPLRGATFPQVPGHDVAGEVVAVGPGVTAFAVGDRVHGRLRTGEGAACAELTIGGVDVLAPIPPGMDPGEAAALPLAGLTALQGLRDRLEIPLDGTAKARILIVGASGGVGHLAVQLARLSGGHVVGVCSGRNTELVASLGAHEVVDYTVPDAFAGQAPFDAILDCVGGPPSRWTGMLVSGGRYASTMPGPAVFLRQFANPLSSTTVRAVLLFTNAGDLRLLDGWVAEGRLRVVVDGRWPLARLADAWTRSQSGRAVGKIVIDVGNAT